MKRELSERVVFSAEELVLTIKEPDPIPVLTVSESDEAVYKFDQKELVTGIKDSIRSSLASVVKEIVRDKTNYMRGRLD